MIPFFSTMKNAGGLVLSVFQQIAPELREGMNFPSKTAFPFVFAV